MKNKFFKQLLKYAKTETEQGSRREKLNESPLLRELYDWNIIAIYNNCRVLNGCLFDSEDKLLSNSGISKEEDIVYFVNQETGYHEDNFYGTMYIQVSKKTFVAISYSC